MKAGIYFKLSEDKRWLVLVNEYSDQDAVYHLNTFLNRKADKYYFDPRYKSGMWDGYISFFINSKVRVGLWSELLRFQEEYKYRVTLEGLNDFFDMHITHEEVTSFADELITGSPLANNPKFEGYHYYQLDSAHIAIQYKMMCSEIATSGGKTLIAYMIAQYLKHKLNKIDKSNKLILIVPRVGLVEQTLDEFETVYNNGKYPLKCMGLGGTKHKFKKETFDECELLITTYQSLGRREKGFMNNFVASITDEAHTSTNATITKALKKASRLEYIIGLSGTLVIKPKYANYAKLQETIGPVLHKVSAKELIDGGKSASVDIKVIKLKYDHPNIVNYKSLLSMYDLAKAAEKEQQMYSIAPFKNLDELISTIYHTERAIVVDSHIRKEFIVNLTKKLNKNTLILFNNVKDEYGKELYEMFKKEIEHTFYIDGDVKSTDRSDFQKQIEKLNGAVLVASYGTFSTGINLKNIHYIVFAESYKSAQLIRQSIGRGMRLLEEADKFHITIIDLVDAFGKYSKRHMYERTATYRDQQFPYDTLTKEL